MSLITHIVSDPSSQVTDRGNESFPGLIGCRCEREPSDGHQSSAASDRSDRDCNDDTGSASISCVSDDDDDDDIEDASVDYIDQSETEIETGKRPRKSDVNAVAEGVERVEATHTLLARIVIQQDFTAVSRCVRESICSVGKVEFRMGSFIANYYYLLSNVTRDNVLLHYVLTRTDCTDCNFANARMELLL